MSSSARSFFRSNHIRNKKKVDIKQQQQQNVHEMISQQTMNEWITNINSQQISMNISCCGGDEKKNAIKKQIQAPRLTQETVENIKTLSDPMEPSDHKIHIIQQQQAVKTEIDDDLKDLFGKKEITEAIINQLAQRALTGPMNSNNDNSPRLCTKKHCSFANEPLTIKPVTCIPGIGPKHGYLCEKQGIIMAHQLLSRYMMSTNDKEFEKSLINQLGFTSKSASMTRDGLKEMRRHLI
ncbi:unnamed protein product [Adineta steineri]|uniref:Uncharacterized protein n=1 Tax=Adineta steineri TaxID=433720 RepID=A0A814JZV1_9BILA|nr:unnamed protein product [Adineta steineri]CAF3892581.1 unnamed protein product [Adineta steineri]